MNERSTTSDSIREAELDFILHRAQESRENPDVWGLALSGGGIRSATFALGVLQVLARNNLLGAFHYLSTISGGGYIGSFVQGLIRRRGFAATYDVLRSSVRDTANAPQATAPIVDAQRPILHLREYGNYLSPRKSPVSGDTLSMLGTYVRNVVLVQTQLLALMLALSLIPLFLYPRMMRAAIDWPFGLFLASGIAGGIGALLLGWILMQAERRRSAPRADTAANASAHASSSESPACDEPTASGAVDSRDLPPRRVAGVALAAIGLLFVAALCGATSLWGFNTRLYGCIAQQGSDVVELCRRSLDLSVFTTIAVIYFVCWIIWLAVSLVIARRKPSPGVDESPSPLMQHGLRFALATLGASLFAGIALVGTRHIFYYWIGAFGLWHALILGPTCVLVAITLTGIFHIGLAGPSLSDLQREIWARIGGRAAAFVTLFIGLWCGIAIYGPLLLRYGLWYADTTWMATGWVGVLGWIGTTGAGVLAAYSQRVSGDPKGNSRTLSVLALIAPWVFLLGLAVAISFAGQEILGAAGWGSLPSLQNLHPDDLGSFYVANLARGTLVHYGTLVAVFVVTCLVWLVLGYAIDLNEFSMNAFYRNRIVRCYLGASNPKRTPEPTTNFDPNDDLVLADVVEETRDESGARPLFPLIGAALNLVATKQLDWQDRKAASFCFTPGYCGYVPPPSHRDACPIGDATAAVAATTSRTRPASKVEADPIAASLTLGDVVAISGAAVSPNMGYHSSPAVTLLLTMFDARLGWWLPNPNLAGSDAAAVPRFSGWWLIAEMLGLTRERGRLIYLSDGGHFENLGIYELVRRRCRFILCVDSSADAERDFADLGDAIQKCRVDFGVDIEMDTSDLRKDAAGVSKRCCAVGTITYAEGETGVLLYLKPSIVGAEPADVAHYARAHPSFPHEPTSDQYFDEAQFESYRRLGESVASTALESALERAKALPSTAPHGQLGVTDSHLKERILVELQHRWVAPLACVPARFSQHADSMSLLFAKLRETADLGILDAQIYPPWTDLVAADKVSGSEGATPYERRTRLPPPEHFRSCFYFCQELIQLMESVYHDMDLEHAWKHPDNRGWMNIFRHWTWSPIFRVAWAVGSPTFGRSFLTFCEHRLELPRMHDIVVVREETPDGAAWVDHCTALAADGRVNDIELGILKSDALLAKTDPANLRLALLRIKWLPILKRTSGNLAETTVGVAVIDGTTVRVLRVQDHLRRMGLGAEFVRRVLARFEVHDVDIRAGHYGIAGVVTTREARQSQREIDALVRRQQRLRRARSSV